MSEGAPSSRRPSAVATLLVALALASIACSKTFGEESSAPGTSASGAGAGGLGGGSASASGGRGAAAGTTSQGGQGGDGGTSCSVTETWGENTADVHRGVTTDTYIDESSTDANHEQAVFLHIDGDTEALSLLWFDLTALATVTMICSAAFHIHSRNNDSPEVHNLHPINEAWSEGDVTWLQASSEVPWSTAGCGSPASCSDGVIGSFIPLAMETAYSTAVDVTAIRDWAVGSASNFGFAIKSLGPNGTHLHSSNSGDDGKRPFLEITYEP